MALKSKKTLAKLNLEDKFTKIDGIELINFYQVLHAPGSAIDRPIGIADLGQALGLDAMHADTVLRAAARAGYLEPSNMGLGLWHRTVQGNALAQAKPSKRIEWEQVEAILPAVIEESTAINREFGHLVYIKEILLFGSAMDNDRMSYGDVDLDFNIQRRAEYDSEPQVRDAILERVPESKLRGILGVPALAAESQDASEILRRIKKISPFVSVHRNEAESNGFRRRQIFEWDLEASQPVPQNALQEEVPATVANYFVETPPVTALAPVGRIIDKDPSGGELRFTRPRGLGLYQHAFALEEEAFKPEVVDGVVQPRKIKKTSELAAAGYQHLCPHWKEDIGGLEMLRRTFAWCEERGTLHAKQGYVIRLMVHPHNRFLALDGYNHPVLAFCDYAKGRVKGDVCHSEAKRVTLNDLAGGFAIVKAFHNCLTELKFKPNDSLDFIMDIDRFLSIEAEEMPTLKEIDERGMDAIWYADHDSMPTP